MAKCCLHALAGWITVVYMVVSSHVMPGSDELGKCDEHELEPSTTLRSRTLRLHLPRCVSPGQCPHRIPAQSSEGLMQHGLADDQKFAGSGAFRCDPHRCQASSPSSMGQRSWTPHRNCDRAIFFFPEAAILEQPTFVPSILAGECPAGVEDQADPDQDQAASRCR